MTAAIMVLTVALGYEVLYEEELGSAVVLFTEESYEPLKPVENKAMEMAELLRYSDDLLTPSQLKGLDQFFGRMCEHTLRKSMALFMLLHAGSVLSLLKPGEIDYLRQHLAIPLAPFHANLIEAIKNAFASSIPPRGNRLCTKMCCTVMC